MLGDDPAHALARDGYSNGRLSEDLSPGPAHRVSLGGQSSGTRISAGKVTPEKIVAVQRQIFNNRLDACVTGLFLAMVLVILVDCAREWLAILSRRKIPVLCEAEYQRTAYE